MKGIPCGLRVGYAAKITSYNEANFPYEKMSMSELLNAVQWPAMLATLIAAWLVASQTKRKRSWGFWCFLVSNILWVVWGWHDHAYALIALQVGLFALNLRGAWKNEPQSDPKGRA